MAEHHILRKQLALYQERPVTSKRASPLLWLPYA
jgi:hypothetical protein